MSLFKSIDAATKPAKQVPLREKRIIPVVHPTQNQSAVLAKIAAAPTPKLAASNISDSPNLAAARDMLEKMGLIRLDDTGAHLTDQGKDVMINHNLMDPSGSLTQDGQTLANNGQAGPPQPAPGADLEVGMDMDGPGGSIDVDNSGEEGQGDISMELGLGDEDFEDEGEGDEEKGKKDEKPKMKAKDQAPEENMENFNLLPALRQQAIVESLGKVPRDLMSSLTSEEIVALRRALDGEGNLYDVKSLYDKLYSYFRSEMPYGTAKGRTGDPEEWMLNALGSGLRFAESAEQYAAYFDATGAGRGPEPVGGPFLSKEEADQWMTEEGYDLDPNYFVEVYPLPE